MCKLKLGPKKKKKLSYRHWPLRQFKQGALQQIKSMSSKNLIQNERKVNREETSRKLGLSWINFPESLLKSRHLGRHLVFLARVLFKISNCAELKSILAPVPMYTPGYPFNRWAHERKMTMTLLYLFYFFLSISPVNFFFWWKFMLSVFIALHTILYKLSSFFHLH